MYHFVKERLMSSSTLCMIVLKLHLDRPLQAWVIEPYINVIYGDRINKSDFLLHFLYLFNIGNRYWCISGQVFFKILSSIEFLYVIYNFQNMELQENWLHLTFVTVWCSLVAWLFRDPLTGTSKSQMLLVFRVSH